MKLEVLTKLIQAADYLSFRELALLYLGVRGFQEPVMRDGWRDGGSDVSISAFPPNPALFAIQISVEWDWAEKTRADARKAKSVLGITNFMLVSSRRIAEAEFNVVRDELFKEGISAIRADSQDLASLLVGAEKTIKATEILGIHLAAPPDAQRQQLSARSMAAYSYVFFGQDPTNFRDEAVQATIKTILADGPCSRTVLETKAVEILKLGAAQRPLVSGCVDQLLQTNLIQKAGANLTLVDWVNNAIKALHGIRDRQHDDLRAAIATLLKQSGVKPKQLNEITVGVMDDLGALLLEAAHTSYNVLSEEVRRADVILEHLKKRLRHLHSLFDTCGLPEGGPRRELIEKITGIASASPYGKSIIAGELFLCLTQSAPSMLMRVMGNRIDAEVLLDASVAIPMIASLLFRSTDHKYFVASNAILSALKHHQLKVFLPDDYLGEVAGHLVRAFTKYGDVVDKDPDLQFSENAFVAHYVGLRLLGEELTFDKYLQLYGYDQKLRKREERVAIEAMKHSFRTHFAQYGIHVKGLFTPSREFAKKAEIDVIQTLNALGEDRLDLLVRHDAHTTAYLYSRVNEPFKVTILTSWDGLHFRLHQEAHQPVWETINPGVLADLLNLTAHVDRPLISPLLVAKTLTEEQSKLGAVIWDHLVQFEKGQFHDAVLLNQARAFKKHFLARADFKSDRKTISTAWQKWKKQGA